MIDKESFSQLLQTPSSIVAQPAYFQEAALRVSIEAQLHGFLGLSLSPVEIAQLPHALRMHFSSIARFWDAQKIQTHAACRLLASQLQADKVNAKGRLISDIDILVKKQDLALVEKTLSSVGWKAVELDDYDEKYYREWSHELPPFIHLETGATVDIHHNLLPSSAKKRIDINHIFSLKEKVGENLYIPSEAHLILHSSIHLLLNDDIEKGLRDCLDLHSLICSQLKKNTPLSEVFQLFKGSNCASEFTILLILLNLLFGKSTSIYSTYLRAYTPTLSEQFKANMLHKSVFPPSHFLKNDFNGFARMISYINGHLSKMPLPMFTKHILYKGYRSSVKKILGSQFFK